MTLCQWMLSPRRKLDLQCVGENSNVEMPSGKQSLQHCHNLSLAELHAIFHPFFIHSFLRKLVLVGCQPPRFTTCWQSREDEVSQDCNGQTDAAIDDEQPSPSSHSSNSIEVRICCGLHVAPEHDSGIVADVPDTCTFIELLRSIL